jgi:putative phosphoribosyl transferase
LNEEIVRDLAVAQSYLDREAQRLFEEIERRRALYLRGRKPETLAGRTVIVVDDGIATGATVRVALQALARSGAARRVLAVPVAPPDVAQALRAACDEAVFLATPALFGAVGRFYEDFRPTLDAEVMALLDQHQASRRQH